jgi:hypothetical protein
MVTASSIIRVSIIGDATGLTTALGTAETKVGGIAKSIGTAFVALKVADKLTDFSQLALDEFDKVGDASDRLKLQLGKLADPLIANADAFTNIGASQSSILTMEAAFADMATAVGGINDADIAGLADDVASTAAAAALLNDNDPSQVLSDIMRAVETGRVGALADLGVNLDGAVTPAERLTAILEQLKPKLDAATTGAGDLGDKQDILGAKVDTLAGKLGATLAPALEAVVDFIIDEIDAIPHAIAGFEKLGKAIEDFGRFALGPLGNVRDALEGILSLLNQNGHSFLSLTNGSSEADIRAAQDAWESRNQGKP